MYVIIKNFGHQYKVQLGQFVKLPKLSLPKGSVWKCNQVLAFQKEQGETVVGTPFVNKMEIYGRVCRHGKYRKELIFKKNRRKGYRRTQGHRQEFTEIYIESVMDPNGKQIKKNFVKKTVAKKKQSKENTLKTSVTRKEKVINSLSEK